MYTKFMSLKVRQTHKQMCIITVQYLVIFGRLDDPVNEIEQLQIGPAASYLLVFLLSTHGQLLVFVRCVRLVSGCFEVDGVTDEAAFVCCLFCGDVRCCWYVG